LDFVKAPGAPGPSKGGVGCLDFVGLNIFCFNATFLFCGGRFGVCQKCGYQPSRHDRKRLASNTPDNKNEVTKQNI